MISWNLCPVCADESASDIVAAITHVLEKHYDLLPADAEVPVAEVPVANAGRDIGDNQRLAFYVACWEDVLKSAGRDIGDGQRLTFDVAYWEWLKKAIFCLIGAFCTSIQPDRDRLVEIEGGEHSPELARQIWLERAGACIMASLACLVKWKEAVDAGWWPTRELSEEEQGQQRREHDRWAAFLHKFRELRFREDVLLFIEAAEAEYAKGRRG